MTQAAVQTAEAKKEALKARSEDMDRREKELNASRSGVGRRVFLAMTRGKNPVEIQFEAFDESQPDTLPKTLEEFFSIAAFGENAEKETLRRLFVGDYEIAYTEASDPVAEYLDGIPQELHKTFKAFVKSFSAERKCSIEDAVNLIKPGIVGK